MGIVHSLAYFRNILFASYLSSTCHNQKTFFSPSEKSSQKSRAVDKKRRACPAILKYRSTWMTNIRLSQFIQFSTDLTLRTSGEEREKEKKCQTTTKKTTAKKCQMLWLSNAISPLRSGISERKGYKAPNESGSPEYHLFLGQELCRELSIWIIDIVS